MKVSRIAIITGSILSLSLFIILSWYPGQLVASLLLIAFLPGYALLAALWPYTDDSPLTQPERWLFAVAVSYGLTVILLLLTVLARLPLNTFSVVGGLGSITLIFAFIAWRRTRRDTLTIQKSQMVNTLQVQRPNSQVVWLFIILFIAALFRMVNIHYSDHQGDEADILLRAVSLVYGHTEAILTHSKGPGEILLLNALGAVTGRFDEQTVRLPFSLAGTISIGLIMLLGWRLFNNPAGIVAGLLGAIDGVFVSYARTAQYQSLMLLLTLAAIYCFYRFHQTGGQSRRLHSLGTFLLAVSFLVHFEAILLLPVIAYLSIGYALKSTSRKALRPTRYAPRITTSHASRLTPYVSRFTSLWLSCLIFIAVIAIFYIPFLLHPNLKRTGTYLENRIGGGSLPPFNNLDHFFYFEALKYNSAYYVVLFNILLLVIVMMALVNTWRSKGVSPERAGHNLPVGQAEEQSHHVSHILALSEAEGTYHVLRFTLAAVVILFLVGAILVLTGFQKLSALAIGLGLTGFLALVILSRCTPSPHKTLWVWIAPSFVTYVFLVNRPGKHHYLFLGALMIFVGLAVTRLWQWATARWPGLRRPGGRWLVISLSVILLVIFATHTVMVLLRSDLEYVLTYPAHKSSFYPTDANYPYGTRIGFGYPFRLGWQVIGQLKRTGQLDGTWAGNDGGNAPNWYMLNTSPTFCYPDYVLRGEITYKDNEEFDVPFEPNHFGYAPRYRIWGNGRLRLTILEFNPLAGEVEPVDLYETARFDPPVTAADFAPGMSPQPLPNPQIWLEPALILGEGSELKNNAPPEYLEQAKHLMGRVALLGYDLETRYARPGGIVPINLYWQAQESLSLRYKVFVHLVSPEGQLWSQADDFPVCGTSHANTWLPGTTILDRHLLKLPPDIPSGDYILITGMYEPDLHLRLNYFDVADNEQGNSLEIGTMTVKPG